MILPRSPHPPHESVMISFAALAALLVVLPSDEAIS